MDVKPYLPIEGLIELLAGEGMAPAPAAPARLPLVLQEALYPLREPGVNDDEVARIAAARRGTDYSRWINRPGARQSRNVIDLRGAPQPPVSLAQLIAAEWQRRIANKNWNDFWGGDSLRQKYPAGTSAPAAPANIPPNGWSM